jgi:hypothetical protein
MKIGNFHFYNTFEDLWFKNGFGLKIMNFEDIYLTKVINFYVKKKHGCIIYVMFDHLVWQKSIQSTKTILNQM